MESKVVIQFLYKDRKCVIVRVECIAPIGTYHNGYVEIKEDELKDDYDNYYIQAEEITFQGDLEYVDIKDGKVYIGFDTAHAHNIDNRHTQTAEAVEQGCRRIVDELEKQR